MNTGLNFFCSTYSSKPDGGEYSIDHKVKHFKKGDNIASQGDRINHLYMLTKGKVKTEIISDSGLTLSVEEISAPYPLAAAFLFADNNRFPVDVIAMEDCEIVLTAKADVEKLMARCPELLRGYMAFIANRVQFLSQRLKIFSQKGIKAKLAYYILQHDTGGTFALGRSMTSLAEYFGVERPSLSRAISEMVRDGVIHYESGKGKILNYNQLKELLG